MNEKELFPKYRFVILGIYLLSSGTIGFSAYFVSPILGYISDTYSISVTSAGYSATLTTLVTGLSMFLAANVISRIGLKKSMLLSTALLTIGLAVSGVSASFTLFLVGRAIVGMAFGFSGVSMGLILTTWFPVKERAVIVSVNTLSIMGFITMSYLVTVPVIEIFGSAKLLFLSAAGVSLLIFMLWIFFGRDNDKISLTASTLGSVSETDTGNHENSLLAAIRFKVVRRLIIYNVFTMVGGTTITLYLTVYLSEYRRLPLAQASAWAGFSTMFGIIGTIIGGVLADPIGRRKWIMVPGTIIVIISSAAIFLQVVPASSIPFYISVYGFFSSFREPSETVIMTEMDGSTPVIASATHALTNGFSQILTFFIPSLITFLTGILGFEKALLAAPFTAMIALVCALLLPETGPKRKI